MEKIRQWTAVALLFTLTFTSIYGQNNEQDDENYSSAYMQSSQTAHWSVYIPIVVLVGAAIYFGLADRNQNDLSSSNSQDALGSIGNSKRIGKHSKTSSTSYKNSRSSSPRSGHSHS